MATAPRPRRRLSPAALRSLDRDGFIAAFSEVFEHSPWVARAAWEAAPFGGLDSLHRAMVRALRQADRGRQVALIRAHPELGAKADAGLTAGSRHEQAGAGLDRCTADELARFGALNRAYREKFGFPFVIAVKGKDRQAILAAFEARLANSAETELARALGEIARIARFRLEDIVEPQP